MSGAGGQSNPFGTASAGGGDAAARRLIAVLRFDLLLMAVLTLVALGGTAVALVVNERHNRDDPVQQGERGDVGGITGASLLRKVNLDRAVAAANAAVRPDEQIVDLTLYPTRMSVYVRNTFGDQRVLRIGLDHKVSANDAGSSSTSGPHQLTFDTAAPERIARGALASEGYAPASLKYLVYDVENSDTPRWSAFYERVPIERNRLIADRHGEHVGVPGEPGAGGP